MKHAFAMRSNLGDPGICKAGDMPNTTAGCFQDLQQILNDMLSPAYADSLRYALHAPSANLLLNAMRLRKESTGEGMLLIVFCASQESYSG